MRALPSVNCSAQRGFPSVSALPVGVLFLLHVKELQAGKNARPHQGLSSPSRKPSCSEDLLQLLQGRAACQGAGDKRGKNLQPWMSDSGNKAGHHPFMFAFINVPVNFKHGGRISRLCRSFKSLRDYQTSHLK